MKVLVVDDDLDLSGLIAFALRTSGYEVMEVTDGTSALAAFRREQVDLVILDVNLPGMDGFEVCRRIRSEAATPILLLTVRNTEVDHVHGLDQGADDYLIKRALLRRTGVEQPAQLVAGDLRLQTDEQAVRVRDGEAVHLTKREFRLLQYLMAHAGHTISVERLTTHVWGPNGESDRQLLKQIVHRVRQKIEDDPALPGYLVTVPGAGYRLQPLPER